MVEGTGLENRRTGNGIESSNLSLSVWFLRRGGDAAAPFCLCMRSFDPGIGGRVV